MSGLHLAGDTFKAQGIEQIAVCATPGLSLRADVNSHCARVEGSSAALRKPHKNHPGCSLFSSFFAALSSRTPPAVPAQAPTQSVPTHFERDDTGARSVSSPHPAHTLDIRPAESMPACNGGSKGPHRRHPARKLPFPPSAPLLTRHRETAQVVCRDQIASGERGGVAITQRAPTSPPIHSEVHAHAPLSLRGPVLAHPDPTTVPCASAGKSTQPRLLLGNARWCNQAVARAACRVGGSGRQGEFGGGSKHVRRPAREQGQGVPIFESLVSYSY
ncbi:hypothetical protein B0H13DRAFT_2339633 [Mycena leptocephala]|nr:hypothetical protein B0H13DRAFT_2339633 [Mycena leptocephala]